VTIDCTCLAESSDNTTKKFRTCGGNKCTPKIPESGHVLAPWVKICFLADGGQNPISVSNESSPSHPHKACIKSFEFGHSDGLTVRVVIQDQEGGAFETFFERLLKDWSKIQDKTSNTMMFQFGWVKSSCGSPHPNSVSPCYFALMLHIETSFSEGKFTAEITGKDKPHYMFEGGYTGLRGGNGEKGECLKDAIKKMMTSSEQQPNLEKVSFSKMVEIDGKGQRVEAGFRHCDDGCSCKTPLPQEVPADDFTRAEINRGPKGKWQGHGSDKVHTALRWLKRNYSNNKKGWIPVNNPEEVSEMIFWEDKSPKCTAKGDSFWNSSCLGTYIVNGGIQSPVIEFNPKIGWDFTRMQSVGGDMGTTSSNPHDNEGSKNPGRKECPTLTKSAQPGAGHVIQVTESETSKDRFGENNIIEDQKSIDEALRVHGQLNHDIIEADLVVVGDPTLVRPMYALQSTAHIIFVNPYHIQHNKDNFRRARWTVGSEPCNKVLSNPAWRVKSITHKIELGNYTTTLNLYLMATGVQGDVGQPIGLHPEGWTPSGTP